MGERKRRIKNISQVTLPLLGHRRVVQLHWSQPNSCWVLTLHSLQTGPISKHIYAQIQASSAQITTSLEKKNSTKIHHRLKSPPEPSRIFLARNKGNPNAIRQSITSHRKYFCYLVWFHVDSNPWDATDCFFLALWILRQCSACGAVKAHQMLGRAHVFPWTGNESMKCCSCRCEWEQKTSRVESHVTNDTGKYCALIG